MTHLTAADPVRASPRDHSPRSEHRQSYAVRPNCRSSIPGGRSSARADEQPRPVGRAGVDHRCTAGLADPTDHGAEPRHQRCPRGRRSSARSIPSRSARAGHDPVDPHAERPLGPTGRAADRTCRGGRPGRLGRPGQIDRAGRRRRLSDRGDRDMEDRRDVGQRDVDEPGAGRQSGKAACSSRVSPIRSRCWISQGGVHRQWLKVRRERFCSGGYAWPAAGSISIRSTSPLVTGVRPRSS